MQSRRVPAGTIAYNRSQPALIDDRVTRPLRAKKLDILPLRSNVAVFVRNDRGQPNSSSSALASIKSGVLKSTFRQSRHQPHQIEAQGDGSS